MNKTPVQFVLRWAIPIRYFLIAAVWLAAALNLPAQSPTADSFNPGASGGVLTLAVQPDGKVLVGGIFTTLGGQPRTNLARLSANGSLDTNFNPGASSDVQTLAVQSDGKIVAGGFFAKLGGQPRNFIGRLNADGSLDTAFNPVATNGWDVKSLALQADGAILVGGDYTMLGGQTRKNLGRLNANGTLDTTFNPGVDYGGVYSLVVQADGRILVGGTFPMLGGQLRNNLGRLNANGTLDTSFNPGADNQVNSIAVQADGKILVAGWFTMLGGQLCTNLGRLNANGTLDTSFNPGAVGGVNCLALQTDGKILVWGDFTTLGGQPRNHIARLNADGSLDTSFDPGASDTVKSLVLQADGKILAGGYFTTLGGQPRNYIGRLNNTEEATQSLAFNGSTITWLRGGTSPEVWRTTFEVCTNGIDWISLGAGTRITGGWQLSGLNYPVNAAVRARGFVCGASWFVESVFAPAIPLQFVNANGIPSISNGWFNLRLTGTTGSNAVVECSSDLTAWIPWKTNALSVSGWDLTAPLGTNGQQFYRAKLAP